MPGRIISSTITFGAGTYTVLNIHNFDITDVQLTLLRRRIEAATSLAQASSMSGGALVLGDFNFVCNGEHTNRGTTDGDASSASHQTE